MNDLNNPNIQDLIDQLNELKMIHDLNLVQFKDLKKIDKMLKILIDSRQGEKIQVILLEFIKENPKIYLAYYYLAVFHYLSQNSGDEFLKKFFQELSRLEKSNLIISIGQNILNYYNSNFILFFLSEILEQKNSGNSHQEALISLWKKMFKQNPNIELGLKLAHGLELIDINEAINYYQLAFFKSYELTEYEKSLKIYLKLNQLNPKNHGFYLHWSKKLALKIDSSKEIIFSNLIKNEQKQNSPNLDYLIDVFKVAFENKVELKNFYRYLLSIYNEKHKDHHFLKYFLKISQIETFLTDKKKFDPIQNLELMNNFEKKIQYDQGKLVEHNSFGIGLIKEIRFLDKNQSKNIDSLKFVIDFERKPNHLMSFRIVSNSLTVLPHTHLKGLKLFFPEKYDELINTGFVEILKHTLISIDHPATSKEIQQFLSPLIYSEKEIKEKWSEFKKILLNNNQFTYINKQFTLKKNDSSFEDITIEKLHKTQQLKNQLKVISFYYSSYNLTDEPSKIVTTNKNMIHAIETIWLKIENLWMKNFLLVYWQENYGIELPAQNFTQIKKITEEDHFDLYSLEEVYQNCYNNFMKISWLKYLEKNYKNHFQSLTFTLLKSPNHFNKELIISYLHRNHPTLLKELFVEVKKNYRGFSDLFVALSRLFFLENFSREEKEVIPILQKLIQLYVQSHLQDDLKKEASYHKKLFLSIQKLFFDEEILKKELSQEKSAIDLKDKKDLLDQLSKLNFLENYLRVEVLKFQEKL